MPQKFSHCTRYGHIWCATHTDWPDQERQIGFHQHEDYRLLLHPNSIPSLFPNLKLNPVRTAAAFDQQKAGYVFPGIQALIIPFHSRVQLQHANTENESFQLIAPEALV